VTSFDGNPALVDTDIDKAAIYNPLSAMLRHGKRRSAHRPVLGASSRDKDPCAVGIARFFSHRCQQKQRALAVFADTPQFKPVGIVSAYARCRPCMKLPRTGAETKVCLRSASGLILHHHLASPPRELMGHGPPASERL
jgi:hypothetical protein